jgi:hypothetical protein
MLLKVTNSKAIQGALSYPTGAMIKKAWLMLLAWLF